METVDYASAGGVAVIRLNRPEKLNAFTVQMHGDLQQALDMAEQDRAVRALVMTGTGRAFCAGQDLGERDAEAAEEFDLGTNIETYYNPLIRRLTDFPMPTLCAVNGTAAGAGVSLALACDIVIAARSAKFVLSFARIGLIPDSGATWQLANRLGQARALALCMTGEPLEAADAELWGLIWRSVDDVSLDETTRAVASQLSQLPNQGLLATRQAIVAAAGNGINAQLDLERDTQRRLGKLTDYREGVRAFKQKRAAAFTSR